MRPSFTLLWVAVIAACAGMITWSARAAYRARADFAEARGRLLLVREQVNELSRLQAHALRQDDLPTAPEDLPRRVSGVIRACGLPASAMASFDAAGSARQGDAVTRRASLVLKEITLPQAGRFLSEWRRAEPKWMVASVDLSPRGEPPAAGGDLPLQAVISMESTVRASGERP